MEETLKEFIRCKQICHPNVLTVYTSFTEKGFVDSYFNIISEKADKSMKEYIKELYNK